MARTRDPSIEARVLSAAVRAYAGAGWSKFGFDSVAKAAGVGKPALYLRWSSREDLLFAAVDLHMPAHELPDTGSIREDMIGMATELLEGLIRGPGAAMVRLQVDVGAHPELRRIHERLVLSRRGPSRAMVLRAIDRGELRPDTPITTLLDLVAGAIGNHLRTALAAEMPALLQSRACYIESVVDAALASFLVGGAPAQASG